MTAPIKFELFPRGASNSLKFAHKHLLNQFFIDQVVTGLSAGNSCLIFTTDKSKPIQRRALNLVPLDSLGSWESIYCIFQNHKSRKA